MKNYFGYVRVSTAKQGEGVSLQEQRSAILRYTERNGIQIDRWFEERETAAKRGRPVFGTMLKLLRQGKARGVVIHKIDRGARNLKDWADLGELIDRGYEVHFANESLDLQSRGGRLSADIQAVVAADYIRNLREEARKGFYGRIKQGCLPLPAPLGYRDMGAGKPKTIDPEKGPLVRQAFELYATGRFNLQNLRDEMERRGLRNRNGAPLSMNGISTLLNNPFYIGLIRLKRTRETFQGGHEPLIRKDLFEQVQAILSGKTNTRSQKHNFTFRRLVKCKSCHYSLIGETRKGHVYYRCQTKTCPTTYIKEEMLDAEVLTLLRKLEILGEEEEYLDLALNTARENWSAMAESGRRSIHYQLGQIQAKLARLTDAFLDGTVEKELFEERKAALFAERRGLQDKLTELADPQILDNLAGYLGLVKGAFAKYKLASTQEKRDLVEEVTSDRFALGKTIEITPRKELALIAARFQSTNSGPCRDIPRTWDRIIVELIEHSRGQSQAELHPNPELGNV